MDSIVRKESGFFKDKHLVFCKNLSQNELNSFASLTNDEDRFEFVSKCPTVHGYDIKLSDSGKSESEAKLLKEQGNKAFQIGDNKKALCFYNRAILRCPVNPENQGDLAILKANSSAALYHIGEYKAALKDIDLAVNLGYPKDLLYKIKDRKARCLLALKQNKSAVHAFRETLQALDDAKLKIERRQKWQKDVQIMMALISKSKAVNVTDEKKEQNLLKLPNEECNPVYKAASNAVTIKESNEMGRYAVAKKNIKIGDIILIEQPHCAVLLEEYALINCFQCFRRLTTYYPCPTCTRVAFCSEACCKMALSTHHKYECAILQTLWASGASVTCFMALRIITQKPLSFFKELNLQEKVGQNQEEYKGSDYRTVYNLVTHEEKRSAGDLLHRAHMAVFLFRCLKESGYFKQEDITEEEDSKNKKHIGGLLLHNLQLLQFNAHEVSEMHCVEGNLQQTKSIFVGGAVFPTLALFNHSCNPSLTRYFQGTTVVARAIRNLNKGELIAENYGPIFTQTPKNERQQTLKTQYWFNCSCEACNQDWPIIDKMDPNILRFRCEAKDKCNNVICVPANVMEFMIRCTSCSHNINIMKGLKALEDSESLFRIAKSSMEEGNVKQAIKKFTELLQILDETLAPPFREYHLCQQAIRTCYLALGNIYSVLKL